MLNEKYKVLDGNIACSNMAYLFSEVCAIYPITPSSPMASNIDLLRNKNHLNMFNDTVELIEMQSEAGVAGAIHGALQSGALASTFTSSQGLLLMIPNMYKIAGEMLPAVIHVSARSLATHALSIFGDHQDVYATRSTGFCMMASSNISDAQNLTIVSHLSALKGSLPFLHFFDGFRTSHELNTVIDLENNDIIKQILQLVDHQEINDFRNKSLNVNHVIQKGLAENEDIYFQSTEARNKDYLVMPDIVNNYMKEINKLLHTNYQPFNYYGSEDAQNIIVAMGSVNDTIKLVIDDLVKKGENIGLIEVHLYRPFSAEYFLNVLPKTVKNIAVLDRTKEPAMNGEPLYLDVLNILKNSDIKIVGGRYGLSSKDTTPDQINSVFTMLKGELKDNFTIGIVDDITHLSLPSENYKIKLPTTEIKIYGYGSDGMVSASKDILKIIFEKNNKFVQGYFQYDSKKSGGVTISHLRISDKQINAPYYVENPKLVVITKEEYLFKYDMLKDIEDEGIVLLNTSKKENELNNFLPNDFKEVINSKKLKLFTIDANSIALKNNLKGKISKIMEAVILKELKVNDYKNVLIDNIKKSFKTKGNDIIDANINSLEEAINSYEKVHLDVSNKEDLKSSKSIYEIINSLNGNELKVSDLLEFRNGTFPGSLSTKEKRNIAESVPKWDKNKCIECMQCSLVCPHSVIRPFLVNKDHKYDGKESITDKDKKFIISCSEADCTSCGLCINTCPTNALSFGDKDNRVQKEANDLFTNHENKCHLDRFSLKGSQLQKPKFEFCGACAGCGETPYIKLLTQLFGDKLIIANATGCSSIYGGSAPSTPYSVSWANSLFEDNAEFALGMVVANDKIRNRIKNVMELASDSVLAGVKKDFETFLKNPSNFEKTIVVKNNLIGKEVPKEIESLIDYVPARSIWAIGGDGWAYDIGFGGIDHVLSNNYNVNILVLDTEVYSNTGGQTSKSSRIGQVAEFSNLGKLTAKKDLFKIATTYPNVYAASISLGSNFIQTIKAFKEAEEHDGPSIIIAYAPCIEQGIRGGMSNSIKEEKLAVDCGYTMLMRYKNNELFIDSKEPDFSKYEEFLLNEVRYNALKIKDEKLSQELLKINQENAKKRYNYYQSISKKEV